MTNRNRAWCAGRPCDGRCFSAYMKHTVAALSQVVWNGAHGRACDRGLNLSTPGRTPDGAYVLSPALVEAREDTLPLADRLEERKVTAFTSAGAVLYV